MYGKIALGVLALGAVVLMGVVHDNNMYWYELDFNYAGGPGGKHTIKRGLWTHNSIAPASNKDVKGPLLGNSDKSFCNDDAVGVTGGNCCDHFRETQVSLNISCKQ